MHFCMYSWVPNKRVGWKNWRVGWRVNTFFSVSVSVSFCMLPYSHFCHPTRLFATQEYVNTQVTKFHLRFETVEECKQTCNVDENAQDSLDSGAVCNQASKCGSSRATANWVFHSNSGKCEDGSGLTAGKVQIF